jgi:hypothetical protein
MRGAAVLLVLVVSGFLYLHHGHTNNNLPGYDPTVYEPSPADVTAPTPKPEKPGSDELINGKLSARELEDALEVDQYSYTPRPHRFRCRKDPAGKWDYICTDRTSGGRWGYDLSGSLIVASGWVR